MAGLGTGYMNLNTGYVADFIYGDSNNPVIIRRKSGFNFFAPRLLMGAAYKKLNAFVIVHGTPDNHYDPNPTLWIEFKASYKFLSIQPKIKKGKKLVKQFPLPSRFFLKFPLHFHRF